MKPEDLKDPLSDHQLRVFKEDFRLLNGKMMLKKWDISRRKFREYVEAYKLGVKPKVLKHAFVPEKPRGALVRDNLIASQLMEEMTMVVQNREVPYQDRLERMEEILVMMYSMPNSDMTIEEMKVQAERIHKIIISREKAKGPDGDSITEEDCKRREKQAVDRSFNTIYSRLSPAQAKFFEALVKVAADKVLAEERERMAKNEAKPLTDGIQDAEFKENKGDGNG